MGSVSLLMKHLDSPLRKVCLQPQVCFNGWGYLVQKKKFRHFSNFETLASRKQVRSKNYAAVIGAVLATWGLYYYVDGKKRHVLNAASNSNIKVGESKPDLPYFSLKEVAAHSTKKDGVWVTFGQGVYDISKFIDKHPGGERILMAAGGSLEPFWILYAVHNQPNTLAILEEYRIGNLTAEEASSQVVPDTSDPYALDPRRHPALQPRSVKPFNAEPPPSLLVDSFITPTDLFYVRNHLPVPDVDIAMYKLEISGVGVSPLTLTLDDLKTKFPKHTITGVLQCAGNRRSEMIKVKPVKGLAWGTAAIGNATWSGVLLLDVLKAAGLNEDTPGLKHVQLEGMDEYGASIPVEKALDPRGDVLLAYEMNGQPLTRDHGYPLRAVIPGATAARSVKWLSDILLSEKESSSHWQQNDYKGFSPSVDWDTVDFTKSPAIQNLPVISAICQPEDGNKVTLRNGHMSVKGYAWSGNGQKIVRVDVTADGGKTWHVAKFTGQDLAKTPRHWAWTLWQVDIPVAPGTKQAEIWCKAVDASYNTQPESFENIWNLRGVLSNAYHRVKVNILN